ncbi:MAG: hypothetical protein ACYTHJ_20225, partial [Planctomycetota bacterium]
SRQGEDRTIALHVDPVFIILPTDLSSPARHDRASGLPQSTSVLRATLGPGAVFFMLSTSIRATPPQYSTTAEVHPVDVSSSPWRFFQDRLQMMQNPIMQSPTMGKVSQDLYRRSSPPQDRRGRNQRKTGGQV